MLMGEDQIECLKKGISVVVGAELDVEAIRINTRPNVISSV